MDVRKLLTVSLISFTFLITGCSSKDINTIENKIDEATYQKTMTKVQNDVSEIIGKDYEYVLENMGSPYCTTYYIDVDKVKNISSIDEFNSINNIRLIYPKETNVDMLENSALYMQLSNNIVKEVQTYELSPANEKEEIKSNVDIVLDRYNEIAILSLDKAKNLKIDKYIGEDLELLSKDIGSIRANFEVYDNKREKNVKGYLLNGIDSLNDKVMIVYNQFDKIKDIKIVSISEGLDLLNTYSFFK